MITLQREVTFCHMFPMKNSSQKFLFLHINEDKNVNKR